MAAYRQAAMLADDLRAEVLRWPGFDRWSMGVQLVRATDSVGANIAEATGRWHVADKRRLLIIARGSLHEAEHWVSRGIERGLLADGYLNRIDEIARAVNGLIKRPTPH